MAMGDELALLILMEVGIAARLLASYGEFVVILVRFVCLAYVLLACFLADLAPALRAL